MEFTICEIFIKSKILPEVFRPGCTSSSTLISHKVINVMVQRHTFTIKRSVEALIKDTVTLLYIANTIKFQSVAGILNISDIIYTYALHVDLTLLIPDYHPHTWSTDCGLGV